MPSVFLPLVCLLTDLKGVLHNETPKPLRGEHKRPKGKWKNKSEGGGNEDKRGGGGGGTEDRGTILDRHQIEEWVEKEEDFKGGICSICWGCMLHPKPPLPLGHSAF